MCTRLVDMLDTAARGVVAGPLDHVAGVLAARGVRAGTLTAAGFVCGAGACVAIAVPAPWPALALWLANRLFDGLDGPVARRTGATERGGFLDIVADFAVYAGFVFGVAFAHRDARLACAALLVAYYLSGTAFLALSSLLERRASSPRGRESSPGRRGVDDGRSLRFVGGLAEGTETVIVYVVFCLLPEHSRVIAWVFAAAVAVTAVQRVATGARLLAPPPRQEPSEKPS